MALIDCPSCGKKTSDKAKVCPHCNFALGEATAEDIQRKQSFMRFKKLHSLQNQSMLAMLLFIAGFGFMYWGSPAKGSMQFNLAVLTSVIGMIWYVVCRIRAVLIKRFSK